MIFFVIWLDVIIPEVQGIWKKSILVSFQIPLKGSPWGVIQTLSLFPLQRNGTQGNLAFLCIPRLASEYALEWYQSFPDLWCSDPGQSYLLHPLCHWLIGQGETDPSRPRSVPHLKKSILITLYYKYSHIRKHLPTTVGSKSTMIALGTCLPDPVSEKKVLYESSALMPRDMSSGMSPSGWIPCSKQ